MKKFLLFFLAAAIVFSFVGCNSEKQIYKYNIGDIPPEVISCTDPDVVCELYASEYLPETFAAFEEQFVNKNDNGIIAECEMVEGGSMVRNVTDDNDIDYYIVTPVKILKIYYQNDNAETQYEEGDIVNVIEPYYWITAEMTNALKKYAEGTYVTQKNYYPMMMNKRYLIYAESQYPDELQMEEEAAVLYPYKLGTVCLSEDSLHYQRVRTIGETYSMYYMGAWNKYSGKEALSETYSDVFVKFEDAYKRIIHVDKSDVADVTDGKDLAIIECWIDGESEQVTATENNQILDGYENYTMTTVTVSRVYYAGENVQKSDFEFRKSVPVYQPYYSVTAEMTNLLDSYEEGTLITHSKFYPMTSGYYLLFARVTQHEGETVLVCEQQASAIPSDVVYRIPEHVQVLLGPENLYKWLENSVKY